VYLQEGSWQIIEIRNYVKIGRLNIMKKRIFLRWLVLALVISIVSISAFSSFAANYPTRIIKLIVPWGAGGNADIQARLLAKAAEPFLGQSIVVINKPGGATVPGVAEALQAPADGYTLIWIAIPSVATQPYMRETPFTYEDLTPIVNVSENSIVLYVLNDSPWYTLEQFLNYVKKTPVNISCNGIGALPHLAAAELAQKSNAKFRYITYKSSAHAVVALIGKHVDAAMAHEPQAFSHGEKMRALAIFEPERSINLPLVPTAKEQGYDVVGYVRDGVAIKKGAPKEVIDILGEAFKKAMQTNEFKFAFLERRTKMRYLDSKDTLKLWVSAAGTYSKIIRELGIKK